MDVIVEHITDSSRWSTAFLHMSEIRKEDSYDQHQLVGKVVEFTLEMGREDRFAAHDAIVLRT